MKGLSREKTRKNKIKGQIKNKSYIFNVRLVSYLLDFSIESARHSSITSLLIRTSFFFFILFTLPSLHINNIIFMLTED